MNKIFRVYDRKTEQLYEVTSIDFQSGYLTAEKETNGGKVQTAGYIDTKMKNAQNRFRLLQDVGIFDKYGLPIFEGDIVQESGKFYEVIREGFLFNLDQYFDQHADYPTIAFFEGSFDVVGNVFENPELIQKLEGAH